ncbi:MAG: saccharopine dehydrogenase NADP-binding domain-containing protein [Myxococcales bacterium]
MIYGANGYTGELLAEEAIKRGHRPVLAGRSEHKLKPLAQRLGLPWAAFDLNDAAAVRRGLEGMRLVLHAAGPFVDTSAAMIRGCLGVGAHYLDITGEIPVFEHTLAQDAEAKARGVLLMSGVGFDVVPTDCLAAHVVGRVEGASKLEIAIAAIGRPSPGTTKSSFEGMLRGGLLRRNGALVAHPMGKGVRKVRFSDRERSVMPIPWGDLVTAYRTTGVPDITTYMAFPANMAKLMSSTWWLQDLASPLTRSVLGAEPVKQRVMQAIEQKVQGPNQQARERGRSYVWARAENPRGQVAEAWLETLEGYDFTAVAGVRIAEKVLDLKLSGAFTPALAFGADFVLEIPSTRRLDRLPG